VKRGEKERGRKGGKETEVRGGGARGIFRPPFG